VKPLRPKLARELAADDMVSSGFDAAQQIRELGDSILSD